MNEQPDLILRLIDQLLKQRAKGVRKYGVPVLPEMQEPEVWLEHMLEEQADTYVYGHDLLEQIKALRRRIEELETEVASLKVQQTV